MQVLGIRFCSVSPEAQAMIAFFDALGMPRRHMEEESLGGAIFPAGLTSWIEVWREGPGMPGGVMLQIVVDDADAFAAHAKEHGLHAHGPMDAHGERIYFLHAPGGLRVSFQSRLPWT
jgi:hypothetical protein